MNDLEELRRVWQKTRLNDSRLEDDNRRMAERIVGGRVATTQNRLASHYRTSFFGGLLLPIISPFIFYVLDFPIWVAALYAFFGLVMAAVNISFSRYIESCRFMSEPVVKALADAVTIAKRQRLIRAFGISCGLVICVTMFYYGFESSEWAIIQGLCIGMAVGLVFGYIKFRHLSRLVRTLQNELSSLLDNNE